MEALDDTKQMEQKKNITHLFWFAENSLTDHFKQWCEKDLFLLSLFLNHGTVTVVAKFILGHEINMIGEIDDKIHKRKINKCPFINFLPKMLV